MLDKVSCPTAYLFRVVLEVYQPSGSTCLLQPDRVTGSIYFWPYIIGVHLHYLCLSHCVIWEQRTPGHSLPPSPPNNHCFCSGESWCQERWWLIWFKRIAFLHKRDSIFSTSMMSIIGTILKNTLKPLMDCDHWSFLLNLYGRWFKAGLQVSVMQAKKNQRTNNRP